MDRFFPLFYFRELLSTPHFRRMGEALWLYLLYADLADRETGRFDCSLSWAAKKFGVSRMTIWNWHTKLKAEGYITNLKRGRYGISGRLIPLSDVKESGQLEQSPSFGNAPDVKSDVKRDVKSDVNHVFTQDKEIRRKGDIYSDSDNSDVKKHLHPNIFTLYEENIGPLTPLVADELKQAEESYPFPWIEDAFREAVLRNRRSWRYIGKILKNWADKGRMVAERYGQRSKDRRNEGKEGQA